MKLEHVDRSDTEKLGKALRRECSDIRFALRETISPPGKCHADVRCATAVIDDILNICAATGKRAKSKRMLNALVRRAAHVWVANGGELGL